MLNSFIKATLLGSLLLCSVMADAVEVTRLNEADVPVTSRASGELDQAIKDALGKVFVKNSGSQDALQSPSVKAMIANAKSILSQFGYVENDGQLYVRASFDSGKVISTLRSAQLPVWGKQRPLTLMWLATDGPSGAAADGSAIVSNGVVANASASSGTDANSTAASVSGEKVLLGDESDLPLRALFNDASNQAGVPLLFPLLDLDDLMQANVNSVRGFFPAELAGVSGRYQSDFFALVTLDAAASGFDYRVALYPRTADGTDAAQLQALNDVSGNAPDAKAAIDSILSAMSSFYVSQYAVTATGPATDTELVFTGINKLKAVADIETYLGQLSMIKTARLINMQGDAVRFAVQLFGSEEDLRRTLALDPRLAPDTVGAVSGSGAIADSGSGIATDGSAASSEQLADPFANAINPGDVSAGTTAPVAGNRYRWRGQ
ncbi:DUF2066 domain-containing protein [Shewanella sp. JM162201]|uniref:DUF2066 domain-containing protein n=1 Tax=Shewanella jiangmenensis TaxID=2837387 RepID=A0ABS5V524_9GAMM|nr:DUF2066 domain-containing protein [Shewanella jiangmenensis]MBT1445566.1 DUF2066 domain-containing protein [Shewanella jiangmenensis]